MEGDLNLLQTIIIAIVEGLTEFLPVSSTGHMIIAQNVLGVESTEFVKAFTFIIQFGAILSVVCLYWKRFFRLNHKPAPEGASTLKRFLHKYDFYWKLLVAFIPAAVLGLLFSDMIDAMLESVIVVAVMLIVGGVFMLFCDKLFGNGSETTELTEKRAFCIGLTCCNSFKFLSTFFIHSDQILAISALGLSGKPSINRAVSLLSASIIAERSNLAKKPM